MVLFQWNSISIKHQSEDRIQNKTSCSGQLGPGELTLIVADNFDLSQKLLYSLAGLNVLAEGGSILYKNAQRPGNWMNLIGVVEEEDHLVGKLTVYEHLLRKAQLRYPNPHAMEGADRALHEFQLSEFKDCRLLKYGESGALSLLNRNRLKLASECCHEPEILFVNNPFAGMNAEESTKYAAFLREYCRRHNCSAIVTIEGGIYETIFEYFDKAALFCWSKQLYFGNPEEVWNHFSSIKPDETPFDSLIHLLFHPVATREELDEKCRVMSTFESLKNNFPRTEATSERPPRVVEFDKNSLWRVFWVLLRTQWKEDIRSKKTLIGYTATSFVVYAATSAVFFQIPMNDKEGFTDRVGLYFFLSINTFFANSMPIIIRQMGLLPTPSFLMSQYLSSIPLRFGLNIILGTALFYITKAQYEFYYLLIFLGLTLMMILASMSFALMLATAEPRIEYCQILIPFFGIVFFIFGNTSSNPSATWILKWLQYVSLIFYDFQGILDGLLGSTGYLERNNYPVFSWPYSFVALGGFTLLYLALAHVIFHWKYPCRKQVPN